MKTIATYRFKKILFDIETDDLKATKIWCIVAKIIGQDKIYKFPPDKLEEGFKFLQTADVLVGHNILGFDIPIIKKLYNIDLTNNIEDTLVMSRLFNPVQTGGHSLENWGWLLYPNNSTYRKDKKPEDFTKYNSNMLDYCAKDVQLNEAVYYRLCKKSKDFSRESIDIEHSVADIMKQQEVKGFMLDEEKATLLSAKLNSKMVEIEKQVHERFKPKWVDDKLVTPYIKKDGTLSNRGLTDEEYNSIQRSDNTQSFMRQKLVEFNLASRKQIGEYLIDFGWKPKEFTPTGQPIVDEKRLSQVSDIPEAILIAEYMMLQKRVAQVSSWLDEVKDERVHGFVIPNGAITGRMTHRKPNMAQIPSVHKPYGKECRECWTVPEGYKLVGIDASGLELRTLAHYMQNKEYINEVINGDIHKTNQELAGLEHRFQAKTFIFALIYGAGDERLGKIIGGNKTQGASLKKRFIDSLPAFKSLTKKVSKKIAVNERKTKRKFLTGLDGREIQIRNSYAGLNSLLQGGGAIIMKVALIILDHKIKENNLNAHFVANIHDEWQIEVEEKDAIKVGQLGIQSIKEAGNILEMRCPLDGQFKVGGNWSETH